MLLILNYVDQSRSLYKGFLCCVVAALAAHFLSLNYGGPVMLFALLIGMAFNFLLEDDRIKEGVNFSSSFILRVGVAMLGARVLFSDVADLGWTGVLVLITSLISTIIFGVLLSRLLGLNSKLGFLSGGAVSICGISATMALSSVMPKTKEMENYTLITVIMVATFGSILMIAYPVLVQHLGMSVEDAAFFIGGSIHDVSHVVGASHSVSPEVNKLAVVVKMFRVAMLVPMVCIFLMIFKAERTVSQASSTSQKLKLPIPFFLVAFIIIAIINNLGWIPPSISDAMLMVANGCFVIAIVALGMKTNFKQLIGVGYRPILLVLAESLFLGGFILAWIYGYGV